VITESKVKNGTLTLGGTAGVGGTEFACQATNVRLTPSHDESGDEVETLCGDTLPPDVKTTWSLAGTSIQDFDDPAGFIKFSIDNNLTDTEFSWQPNAGDTTVAGTVQVRALEVGGDVNTRITTDFEWPVQGDPTWTWPAPGGGAPAATEPASEPLTEPDAEPLTGPEAEPPTGPETEPPTGPETEPPTGPESEPPTGPEAEPLTPEAEPTVDGGPSTVTDDSDEAEADYQP
jgi:hypothetical protein